jgi:hypothetical protein
MADQKISALTGATTPLAGTEVLPIVQSGSTVKVAVSNLTAGRDVAAKSLTVSGEGAYGQGKLFSTSAEGLLLQAKTGSFFDAGMLNAAGDAYAYTVAPGTNNMKLWGSTTIGNSSGQNHTVNGNLVQGTAAKGFNFTANTPAAGMTSQLLNWYEEGTFTPTIASDAGSVTLSTAVGKYTRIGRQVTINANVTVSASTASANVYLATLPFTPSSNGSGSIYGSSFTLDVTPMLAIDSGSTLVNIQRTNGLGSVATLGPRLQAGTVMYFSLTYFV